MSVPNLFTTMSTSLIDIQVTELLQTNTQSEQYGLTITAEEAKEIIECRNDVLKNYGRVELEIQVTKKIIHDFCASPFINQEDYASTLIDLQEIFYYMKNETYDQIGDDELLDIIKDFYNNSCCGSIELLMGRELDKFVRDFRRKHTRLYTIHKGEED